MKCARAFVLIGIFAAAASCSGGSNVTGGGGGCTGSQTNVGVCNNFFSPTTSMIAAGSSVTWTWKGAGVQHNVTFTSGSLSGTTSGNKATGTFTQMFSTAGTYNYVCTIHSPAMSGTITVSP